MICNIWQIVFALCLRTKVKLAGTGSRGKIEISYFSAGELERIIALVGGRSR